MIRKFYDLAATETATAPSGTPSIASLMASHGVRNETENPVAQPYEPKQEIKTEPAQTVEATPVVPTTEPSKTVTESSETPKQTETKVEPLAQKEQPQPKEVSLQEVLKKESPDAILKALGFDDKVVTLAKKLSETPKMAAFFNHWESKGDIKQYLSALTTDFKTMPAEEVMRHQLRKDYPTASDRAIDILYRKEVVEKYNLDSELQDEKEEGIELLNAVADRYRADFSKNQEDFLLPTPLEQRAPEPDNSVREASETFEGYESKINGSQFVKGLLNNKTIAVGEGDETFNIPISDSREIIDNLLNVYDTYSKAGLLNKETLAAYSDADIETQVLIGLFSKDPKSFVKQLSQHFKSLGGKAAIEPLENAKPASQTQTSTPEINNGSIAAQMAKSGRIASGGYGY